MPTKPVLRRQRAVDVLRTAIQTHQTIAAESLTAVLAPLLPEGEEPIDLGRFQRHLILLLTQREEEMVAADEAHEAEIKNDSTPRRLRDRLAEELTERLRACRRDFVGSFGPEEAEAFLKLDGTLLSSNVEGLLRQARQVVANLRNAELATPAGLIPSSSFDREVWAADLEPRMVELQTAVDAVARERSLAQETRSAKKEAVSRVDETLVATSRLMQGVYRLSGKPDFALEVSPALRSRRGSRPGAEPSPETSEPAPEEEGGAGSPPPGAGNGSPGASGSAAGVVAR